MKIVQVNTVCGTGSTGKIAVDLYHIAAEANHSPYIAFGRGDAPAHINSYKIGNTADFFNHVLINFCFGKSGFGSKHTTLKFLKWLDTIKPDILHLHNIHGFYVHVGLLFEYIKQHNIPVIWTLHDCWPLTGQCAFFDYADCKKWQTGCFNCPIYRTNYPYSLFKDNSRGNYQSKKEIFCNVKNLTIVTPSQWLADIVKQSYLKEYPVVVIPNGINLDVFKPNAPKSDSQSPKILLGVANVWDKRKGLDTFLKLADSLDDSFHIVLIGVSKRQQRRITSCCKGRITALTRTANQAELAEWYSRAYAFINPTLEDNFPTTNLEALACGTPVITYATGGSPECLHDACGIVVPKNDYASLIQAILSLESHTGISVASCRNQALLYDKNRRFEEYLSLYHRILD